MAVLLVTCELNGAAHAAQTIDDYLQQFDHSRQMDALWLVDTAASVGDVREQLRRRVGADARLFVARLIRDWPASNEQCGGWLGRPERSW